MKIKSVKNRTNELISEFLNVWEASVRATHNFLKEEDIKSIKPQVQLALSVISDIVYIADDDERIAGFMAIEGEKIEMLFVHPEQRGIETRKKDQTSILLKKLTASSDKSRSSNL